ncbi:MAG: hypothetical protein Q7U36_04280 [bacterium]|nr:hypothetical protein [bacterium]
MTNNKKKTFEEKIREVDIDVINRKLSQEFISFFEEQKQLLLEVEKVFREKYDISGRGRVITILCGYVLSEIESEIGITEKNGEKI